MANSVIPTHTMLNSWQRRLSESIWAFNQVTNPGANPGNCPVYTQDERDELADALYYAWEMMTEYLGTFPRPIWTTKRLQLGSNPIYELQKLHTAKGHLIEFGSRATTLIEAGATVTYSDPYSYGHDTLATVSVATTVTDPDEIQVFFRTADGAPAAADDRYRIEPATVSISGGTATITAHRALFADPTDLWAQPFTAPNFVERNAGDVATAGDFVTTVDVYRVYNDTTAAITLLSDNLRVNSDMSTWNAFKETDAIAQIVDAEKGLFRVRLSNCVDCIWPEAVDINYRAGQALVNGATDPQIEMALVRLANTTMPQEYCSFCERTNQLWRFDREAMPTELLQPTDPNPFGIARGHIQAWRVVRNRMLVRGGVL